MASAALPYLPWRKPVRESGPIRLGSRRLYILPTRSGLVFAALLLGGEDQAGTGEIGRAHV